MVFGICGNLLRDVCENNGGGLLGVIVVVGDMIGWVWMWGFWVVCIVVVFKFVNCWVRFCVLVEGLEIVLLWRFCGLGFIIGFIFGGDKGEKFWFDDVLFVVLFVFLKLFLLIICFLF